MHNAHLKLFKS